MSIQGRDRAARIFWIAGGAFYLAHVAAAFQFEHHWSHAVAYEATARQTADVFGLNWGGGLYFNYVFTILWIAQAIWWWRSRALQWFFAFMFFNATIVFGSWLMRVLGLVSIVALVVVYKLRRT